MRNYGKEGEEGGMEDDRREGRGWLVDERAFVSSRYFQPCYQQADGNCGCSGANPWKPADFRR